MKKILLMVIAIGFPIANFAYSTDTIGGITWNYTVSDGKAIIGDGSGGSSQIGANATSLGVRLSGAIVIPSRVGGYEVAGVNGLAFSGCSGLTSVTIPDGVTSIGGHAFYGCSGLASVTIPPSVTSIGGAAFYGCSGLASVAIPVGVTSIEGLMFQGCSGLTSVVIPSGVTNIGWQSFSGCSGLKSVAIPSTVTNIADWAFYECSGLTSVEIPSSVTSIGWCAFSGCGGLKSVMMATGVTSIGMYAFEDCSTLASVIIPSSVTSIGDGAFKECSGLKSVEIPSSVTSIGEYAFSGCRGLKSVIIPSSVASIGMGAFEDCYGLELATIQVGVASIGDYAFRDCDSLTSVIIPSSVTNVGVCAFSDCNSLKSINVEEDNAVYSSLDGILCDKTGSELVQCPAGKIDTVVIPVGVTNIGRQSFSGCRGLKSVAIPSSVTNIADWAFYGCSGLKSVTISDGVTSIGGHAFYDCSGLTSVTIPPSVTSIGDYAFMFCSGLISVTIPPSVANIGKYAFIYCNALTVIHVVNDGDIRARQMLLDSGFDVSRVTFEHAYTHYTVVFGANGGVGSMGAQEFVYGKAQALKANAFSRLGYAFAGWKCTNGVTDVVFTDQEIVSNLTTKADAIVDLSAVWSPNSYSVRFNANGGQGVMVDEPMLYGEVSSLTACAFTKTGYTFTGWAVRADADSTIGDCATVSNLTAEAGGMVTLYAKWMPNEYTVDFNPGRGGVGAMPDQPMTYDEEVALCSNLFYRTGYTFLGWTDDENEVEEVLYYDGVVVSNLTAEADGECGLYAIWAANEYTVVFDANGGTGAMEPQGFVYGEAGALRANTFTREYYIFAGWAATREDMSSMVHGDGEVVSNLTAEVDGVVTLYARWLLNGWRIIPGEKVEIDTGLIGYTASGLPTGLTYNRTTGMITGAAAKPGEYAVKFTKSGAEAEEMTIVVTAVPKITVEMVGVNAQSDTNGCKVTGAKEYLVGTKATLTATVPTGTMFEGWFKDDQPWPDEATHLNKSVTYVMGKEDVALVAKFKKEVMTVGCSWLSGGTFTAGVAASAAGIPLEIVTESGIRSVSVTKLPSGMTYDSRNRLITGFPNKAGTYNVEIAVTANSGSVEKRTIPVMVAALPAWAVGNFEGTVRCADGTHGTASFAVSAAGAISSGKLLEHGSNWTFTAKSYATTSVTRGLEQDYVVLADAKCGKATRAIELHVMGCAVEGVAESAAFAAGFFGDAELELWRNVWKDADAKGVVAGIAGKYTYFLSDGEGAVATQSGEAVALPLNLTSAGALSGKANVRARDNASVSFSTTVFASSNGVEAAFYVAPDAKKGYEEIYERFTLDPHSGAREDGVAHRAPGVIAVPEPYPGDSGNGTVSVSPAGGQVDAGKTVTVSASPDSKSVFVKWRYEVGGEIKYSEMSKLTLTMDGEHDVFASAIFRSKESFAAPVVAVETSEQVKFAALELGVQFSAFVTVTDVENMKPVKWSAANLPSGLKINAETGEISGVATAVNTKPVVITATSVADSKKKTTFTLDIGVQDGKPAALPETAVGTFTGFVNDGTDNLGTFTFTSSEKGALSAKIIDAKGTVSFSGSGFAWSKDRRYGVELKTTKGETLSLTLDSGAGWDKDQLVGGYSSASGRALGVSAQRNAFSKAWYFSAEGDSATGWTFAFTTDAKAAALTVTLKADGTTSIAGKLPNGVDKNGRAVTLSVSASGVANAGMMREGAMSADFAPVLTVGGTKKVLAIRTNLWFDRKNDHESGVGEARFVK